MMPTATTTVSVSAPPLTTNEARLVVDQRNGIALLLMLMRDGRVEKDVAIDVITEKQESFVYRTNRLIFAVVNSIYSG